MKDPIFDPYRSRFEVKRRASYSREEKRIESYQIPDFDKQYQEAMKLMRENTRELHEGNERVNKIYKRANED